MATGTLEIYGNDYPWGTVSAGGTDTSSTTWVVSTQVPFPQANYTGNPPSVFHVADPALPAETIQVNYNNSNGTWTVVRGSENTAAVSHAAGFTVKQVVSGVNGYASFYQNANLGATSLTTISNSTGATNIAAIYVPSQGSYPGGVGTGVSYRLTAFGSFTTSSNVANGSSTISVLWGTATLASLVPGVNATRFINASGTFLPFSVRSRVFFLTATTAAAELELVWRNSTVTGATEVAASTSLVTAGPVTINGTSGVATQLAMAWQWTNATSTLGAYGAAFQVQ